MDEASGMRNEKLWGASFVKKSLRINTLKSNANRHSVLFSQGEK